MDLNLSVTYVQNYFFSRGINDILKDGAYIP